jgi:murein L,D-transpeptidase YcbB/YkuD
MSTRIYDGARGALRAEADDDWFATVQQQPAELDDLSWENELEWQLRDPAQPDSSRRRASVGLAVLVAVFLVFAGGLIGRETKGSSTKVVTVAAAPQVQETPATSAAADKSAATSTPSTSTSTPGANTPAASTGASTSSIGSSSPGSSAVPTDATLRGGAKGAAVTALQQALTALGYAPGTADGAYGATTAQAVTAFQKAKSLTADGVAGATTLAAINAGLASG